MSAGGAVIVLAKAPVPGRVKTRLCPPCTHQQAAALAAAALADTLEAVAATRCGRRVLAVDDPRPVAVPEGFDVAVQPAGGLAARLDAAFAAVGGPAVLVGMDTPQVTPGLLESALGAVRDGAHAVLGLAVDGGFWAVGMHRPRPCAFAGVPMSTPATGRLQHARLRHLGLDPVMLPVLRDVDHVDDACIVAESAPQSRFAAVLARVRAAAVDALP